MLTRWLAPEDRGQGTGTTLPHFHWGHLRPFPQTHSVLPPPGSQVGGWGRTDVTELAPELLPAEARGVGKGGVMLSLRASGQAT